jgi:hypothetical protein
VCALTACATSSPSGGIDGSSVGDDDDGGNNGDPDADPTAPDADPTTPPPDANSCATQPCDLVPQCGCPANQACDIDFTDLNGTACRGIASTGDENDTCTAINQCDAGYVCVGDSSGRTCERYCETNADCTAPRGLCAIQLIDQQQMPIAGATICSSNCDPVAASNPLCPTGWGCDLFTAGTAEIVDCRVNGTATQGQACSATVHCAANFTCVNDSTSDVCGRICRRPAGTECSASPGTTCLGFTDAFVVGGQEYGVCL